MINLSLHSTRRWSEPLLADFSTLISMLVNGSDCCYVLLKIVLLYWCKLFYVVVYGWKNVLFTRILGFRLPIGSILFCFASTSSLDLELFGAYMHMMLSISLSCFATLRIFAHICIFSVFRSYTCYQLSNSFCWFRVFFPSSSL